MMGTELVLEMPENLHTLTRLSAQENFIESCRRENFKNYIINFYEEIFYNILQICP